MAFFIPYHYDIRQLMTSAFYCGEWLAIPTNLIPNHCINERSNERDNQKVYDPSTKDKRWWCFIVLLLNQRVMNTKWAYIPYIQEIMSYYSC